MYNSSKTDTTPPPDTQSKQIPIFIANQKYTKMPSCTITLNDLKKLFIFLEEKVNEAADIEYENLKKVLKDKTPQNLGEILREQFRLMVKIEGL
ncbi:MAG: hypothetical protein ACLFUU_09190 [Desulfobacteraceae bacterium]